MGGARRRADPEKLQNMGFLSNTGPDPLENHKAIKAAFDVSCFAGGPHQLLSDLRLLCPLWLDRLHQLKKNVARVDSL